ncbi:phage-related hypothetical protein [Bordetella bronchiseptica RB50]|uniref:Uncharacterized protein n=1 Tax=Bordetella bronchiseptica (strain ATCC BAA-588 / NCTC 13252 / RB50) TaxID=257310 RepID=A0A0H3LYR1_BORBR|nr:hypothetical protein AZ14_3795 [Bordetella bronchiseptica 980]CAE35591.1 phage-related hypothetical protein [Bordetella bronchiseptica RB50]
MTFPELSAAIKAVGQLLQPGRPGRAQSSAKTTRIKSLRRRPPTSEA